MTIILNVVLFLVSGLFSVLFFSRWDFYGFADTMASRTTILYILGGIILTLGGIVRLLNPGISLK
jgi:hypothetical protein